MNPGTATETLKGVATTEPAFGLPAIWITEDKKERAMIAGYTVVDCTTVVATHISEIIKQHGYELIGRQEVQNLLDNVSKTYPKLVEELVPNLLTLGAVMRVLQNLLRENVSIRDIRTILETARRLGAHHPGSRPADRVCPPGAGPLHQPRLRPGRRGAAADHLRAGAGRERSWIRSTGPAKAAIWRSIPVPLRRCSAA